MNYGNQYGQNNQSNQGLPYNPTQLNSNPRTYPDDNPPCVPEGVNPDQQFSGLIIPACAIAATLISNAASSHSGRIFLYNQVSANNYNNRNFAEIVNLGFDLLFLGLNQNKYRSPDEGLYDAITKGVAIGSAMNFRTFPELANYVGSDIANDAQTNLNAFASIISDINSIRNGNNNNYRNGNNNGNNYNNGNNNGNNNSQYGNYNNGNNNQGSQMHGGRFDNRQPFQQPVRQGAPTNGSNPYDRNYSINRPNQPTPASNQSQGRYDYAKTASKPTVVVVEEAKYAKTVVMQEPVNLADKWSTSTQQPYIPNFDPRSELLDYRMEETELGPVVIAYIVKKQGREMNKDEHSTTTTYVDDRVRGFLINPDKEADHNFTNATNILVDSSKQNIDEVFPLEEAAKLKLISSPVILLDNFIEPAIFRAKLQMLKAAEKNDLAKSAYRVKVLIATPIITAQDETLFMNTLLECKSFAKIKSVVINGLKSKKTVMLAAKVDALLTKEINSVLRNKLSIKLNIDSFAEDGFELIQHLSNNNKFGLVIAKAYQNCEDDFIKTYFDQAIIDKEQRDGFYESFDLEGASLNINYLSQIHSVTFINAHSSEFGIGFNKFVATGISYENNLHLYMLADDIFKNGEEDGQCIAHKLVVTADDKVYEFHKGLLGDDFYTVSEFN